MTDRRWRERFVAFNWQPLWLPLTIMGGIALAGLLLVSHGWDLHAYWALHPDHPYGGRPDAFDAFLYSPPAVLALAPLGILSWPGAQVVWLVLQLACLWLIGRRWALALVLFPPVWLDLAYGNANIMLTAAIVIGMRHPSTWAFVLLSKVSPGVGLLWFVVRREWRAVTTALLATAAIALLSVVVFGTRLWADWLAVLDLSRTLPIPPQALQVPVLPRLAIAAAVVAWGGLTDRRWTVPVACTIAMPLIWPIALVPLVAIPFIGTAAAVTHAEPADDRDDGRVADRTGELADQLP